MKTLLATLALALAATGCLVRVPPPIRIEGSGHRTEERDRDDRKRCPPGHEWSDGRCHERGRGHDDRR